MNKLLIFLLLCPGLSLIAAAPAPEKIGVGHMHPLVVKFDNMLDEMNRALVSNKSHVNKSGSEHIKSQIAFCLAMEKRIIEAETLAQELCKLNLFGYSNSEVSLHDLVTLRRQVVAVKECAQNSLKLIEEL